MDDLEGRVAVVTGAASGIGRALADAFSTQGMSVVLADIDGEGAIRAAAEVAATGGESLAIRVDVGRAQDIVRLADATIDRFGAVHVVCNNAGVGVPSRLWETNLEDWKWQLGVNLWGVIHSINTFVPIMIEQGAAGHIVNTASVAGLIASGASWRLGAYSATKHAVVGLSEALHGELISENHPIGVSVLCPGAVDTRIWDSRRAVGAPAPVPGDEATLVEQLRAGVAVGRPPAEVAELVIDAVKHNRMYVLPGPEVLESVRRHYEHIAEQATS